MYNAISTGFRFRAYPKPQQRSTLMRWIGCQEYIYSAKVQEDRYYRRFKRKLLGVVGERVPVDQQYARFISDELTPWLREVPSVVLRNGATKWAQAYQRYFKGLGGRPVPKNKHGKRSVWLTSELFKFVPIVDVATGEVLSHRLLLGTSKFPLGEIRFVAHRAFEPPASIHVSVDAGRWFVSFCNEQKVETPLPTKEETVQHLLQFSEAELLSKTLGGDRGVAIPLATNAAGNFDVLPVQGRRLVKKEKRARRWQRIAARRIKGSANRRKANRQLARAKQYAKFVRQDFAHQTSHALAQDDRFLLYVFEALKTKNMTASAKGSVAKPGKKVRQKAGLNRSILSSAWGQMELYLDYKTQRKGKLFIKVPPQFSSQECSACGHTSTENRPDQALFLCTSCGHTDNADTNAAKVLAKRGVRMLLAGELVVAKEKKRCSIRKQNPAGAEGPEPAPETAPTPVETVISRGALARPTPRSPKQETPTTTAHAV